MTFRVFRREVEITRYVIRILIHAFILRDLLILINDCFYILTVMSHRIHARCRT